MDDRVPVEQELNLRAYSALIVKHWKRILGLALAAMLVAAAASSLLSSPAYEAVAVLKMLTPRYHLVFESRFQSVVESSLSAEAYATLAKDAEPLRAAVESLGDTLPPELRSPEALGGLCRVSSDRDSRLVWLTVRHTDAQLAAQLANSWADAFVQYLNQIYGTSTVEIQQLGESIRLAEENLRAAEQALMAYDRTNPTRVLAAVVAAESAALSDYLRAETNAQLVLQDVESLKERLEVTPSASSGLASALSALLTELNALSAHTDLGAQIQVTLGPVPEAQDALSDQLLYLESLTAALEAKAQALAAAREEIPARILKAQGELRQAQTEMDRLTRARSIAEETYLTLSRKLEEVRVDSQVDFDRARITSPAGVPLKPSSPSPVPKIAIAGILGLAVGLIAALALEHSTGELPAAGD